MTTVATLANRCYLHFPRILRLLLLVTAVNVLFFFSLRLIFWFLFNNPDETIPAATLLKSFYIGLKFDTRLALMLVLPLFLLGWNKWFSPFSSARHRLAWLIYFGLAQFFVVIAYTSDFGYYAYMTSRLDATSLRLLQNPLISAQMVWQTYPVIWGALILALVMIGYQVVTRRILDRVSGHEVHPIRKRHKLWVVPVSLFFFLFGIYGKFSFYPLRWSDAFFSTYEFASAVALNPVLYFMDTLKNRDSGYNIETTKQHYPRIADYLGLEKPADGSVQFRRHVKSHAPVGGKPNVVMVFLESFAAFKVGAFGNPLNPTPNFDKLASEGIFYTHFYTPHTGTARSVFTALTGIPDIEQQKTSSRNPLIVKQKMIVNEFRGYEKLYFLGGSTSWGNIRGILSGNIPGLQMYEEGSYSDESQRVDVWGIPDLQLFREANKVLREKRDKPFFAIIQTAGNHRPYTIPTENEGFRYEKRGKAELLKFGFHSEEEYNSFRFMDHSVGKFMEMARKEGYYNNTIFAFFGDHGLGGRGDHIPNYIKQLNLHHVHVPFVIYAPGLLKKAERHDAVAGEVDVLPTLAGLALPEYTNTTFGRDLRDPRFDGQRYAFTIKHTQIPEIGVVGDKYYFQMYADGSNQRLFRLDAPEPRINVIKSHPDAANQLHQLCIGLYETAKYVRFNNAPSAGQTNHIVKQ
ncbi:MAG: LTA synthase family protein [Gammaproteobacteria bacterium]|nr:LTA synthase family protein [Gammaproteobacteria bacterium]MDH5651918.1 LTA synthase family protein [Gammaproteobacteria bacterium]